MKLHFIALFAIIMLFLAITSSHAIMQHNRDAGDWGSVERIIGMNGTMLPGGVFMIELPRNDLKVMMRDIRLKSAFALDSWVAFKRMGNDTMMMGDLVLTDDEMGPVQKAVHKNGVEISAIHNTLIGESPKTYDLHIGGMGDPVKMAETIHDALLLTKTPYNNFYEEIPINSSINYSQLDRIMGYNGSIGDGVYQYSIPRAEPITMDDMEIPPTMDVATSIKFQPIGDGKAATTGDFILTSDEVNPVITALNNNGIEVVALHNHMLNESPRMFFMHFWGVGDALDLARGLHAAIEKTKSAQNTTSYTYS
jgi:hypothetical protein